ncbi:SMAD/FHA domain-containing protein [Xylaria bambusicola]|uniref:SMAD/FHA domain-containing protein n=1 Tax=Xylaria bambusicola TaxID=326684 RepID=UPI002008B2B0|nr:SMAD/FHA domain-containing protein [Xylaria bambusicola]KAI0517816.1 SMAD/FHA domain-containing protein [Xylaria bambusicola]
MGLETSPVRSSRRPRDHSNERRHTRHSASRPSHRDDFDNRDGRKRDRSRERSRGRSTDTRRRRRSRSPRDSSRRRSRSRERRPERERQHRRKKSHDYDRHDDRSYRGRREGDGGRDSEDQDNSGKQVIRRNGPLPSQTDSFALTNGEEPPKPKEKPNFGNSGTLAAASNSVTQADGSTTVLKYHEPPEARKPSPKDQWKLFVFKGEDIIDTVPLSNRSCWLVGRDTAVVDMMAEHPSVSKQHAVIQFRYIEKRNEYGDKLGKVKPYLIDLESANGTSLNSKKVPQSRYLELRDKDMIQFGQSTREYVLMLAPKD